MPEFRRRETHVERHDDGAGLNHSVVALEELVVVEAEEGDAVSLLDAGAGEGGGESLAPLTELGIGEGLSPQTIPTLRPNCLMARSRQRSGVNGTNMVDPPV